MNQGAWYDINGVLYARVTSILGVIRNPALETWRGRLGNAAANKTAREAARIGTAVHGHIARYIEKGERWKLSKKIPAGVGLALGAFDDYAKLHGAFGEQCLVEKTVWHESRGYAGTVDLMEPTVITDWKTAGSIKDTYWLQLSAYWQACIAMGIGAKISTLRIVRLDRNLGMFEQQDLPVEEALPFWDAFQGLLGFYGTWMRLTQTEEELELSSAEEAPSEDSDVQSQKPMGQTPVRHPFEM